jgi:Oxidoreductase family, NAD-binding Rossmann fold
MAVAALRMANLLEECPRQSTMTAAIRVVLVGLGTISRVHQRALLEIPQVTIVGGVDPEATSDSAAFPVYAGIDQIAAFEPDVVIVAAPSIAHMELIRQIRSQGQRCIVLVEKPMATNREELQLLVAGIPNCFGMYHAAEGPEVIWAAASLGSFRRAHGEVVRFESLFADPIAGSAAERAKCNCWLDSGINALSILDRILGDVHAVTDVIQLSRQEYLGEFRSDSGSAARIRTLWDRETSVKRSELSFEDGAILILDHADRAALLGVRGDTQPIYVSSSPLGRLDEQYRSLFLALAASDWRGDQRKDIRLHDLLLSRLSIHH